jgi:DNA repair exonuclease SbcCD nuclease subunit
MIEDKILKQPVKRVWVLGDLHFGVRSNSVEWLEIQQDFFEQVFIPTLKKHVKPGDVLVQVGDTFDNRQSVNLRVLHYSIELFEKLGKILPVHVICGNHDIWAKKSNDVSSIDTLKWIPNVQVYKKPKSFKWHNKEILLMPWRRDSEHEVETLLKFPKTDIVFCHSEVAGVALNSKVRNQHGTDTESYKGYTAVYSGHIHYRQKKGKLRLVGTPYELTRSDSGNAKGFDLVDLETMEETFFQNDVSPKFLKFNLKSLYMVQLGEFKDQIRNNFVDLYVPSKIATSSALSKLINKVQKISRKIEPSIYEDESMVDTDLYDMDQIEDLYKNYNILHLCNLYVEGTAHDDEMKQKLKQRLKQLHDKSAYNYDIE